MSAAMDWSLTLMVAVDESMPGIASSSWNVATSEKEDLGIQYLMARLVNAWNTEGCLVGTVGNFRLLREVLVLPDKFRLGRVKYNLASKDTPNSLFCI